MKPLFFKLFFLTLFFNFFINSTVAQTERKGWSFEVGLNTVNVRAYTTDTKTILKDYFGNTEWLGNTNFFISRIAVQKYLGKNLTLQLVGSINSLKTIILLNDSNAKYVSIDVILKRNFKKLFASKDYLDPYILSGMGSQTIADNSDIVFIGGFGLNIWFNNKSGINLQTSYKHGFNNEGRDVFQHSIGFIYNFGAVSQSGSRNRLWNN